MKLTSKIFGILLAVLLLGACQKDDATGSMMVRMTDQPADYLEVNVDVRAVQIHYEDDGSLPEGWVDLQTNMGIYDLLELQNGVTTVIADEDELRAGEVSQMRLLLGPDNTLVTTSGTYPLQMNSQIQTGIKINLDSEIKADKDMELLLDFDAEKSVVAQGNGEYRLEPVIKVEAINFRDR